MKRRKMLAWIVSMALVIGLMPLGVLAEGSSTQEKTITNFAAVESISAVVGDAEPSLPQHVLATVSTVMGDTNADGTPQAEQISDENVAVTWAADPAYTDAAAVGNTFTYTASLQGETHYTLAQGVDLPTLTVHVVAAEEEENSVETKTIMAIADPSVITLAVGDATTEAELMAAFPKSLAATVEGETAPLSVAVSGWTFGFSSHSSGGFATDENAEMFYEPILVIPEGYTLSNEMARPAQKVQVGEMLVHAPMLMSTGTGDFTGTGDAGSYEYLNGVLTIKGSGGVSIANTDPTTPTTHRISVQTGTSANLTLSGVNIDVSAANNVSAFEIVGSATANITLQGSNTLQSGQEAAGLQAQTGSTLNILAASTGTLNATGGLNAAGIGGGSNATGGTIKIAGGTVTATGKVSGAGIGGGHQGTGGSITISGGTVNAIGGGAGIGGGSESAGGSIMILGGTVTAASTGAGAGIGGGSNAAGGTIKIAGGTVNATSVGGAGIGGGSRGSVGAIEISGGTVSSTGSGGNAGIGSGAGDMGSSTRTITVSGGMVTATGGANGGAGIGSGVASYGVTITISGGIVTAASAGRGAGIGAGENGEGGTFQTQLPNGAFGTAFIVASSISDNDDKTGWNGIIFDGAGGTVYGTSFTLSADSTIPTGKTLTVPTGKTLTVPSGKILTVASDAILNIDASGGMVNNGTIYYYGTINGINNIIGNGSVYPQGSDPSPLPTPTDFLPYTPTGTVDVEGSTVPSGNTLHITEQSEEEQELDLARLREFASENGITGVVHFLADITMTDAAGNEVQPQNGNTRVRISVPGLTPQDAVCVLHINSNGSVEKIDAITVGIGYVEFTAASFSVYGVVVNKAQSTGSSTTALSPQTGVYALPDGREG